jgi:hypothetical protein
MVYGGLKCDHVLLSFVRGVDVDRGLWIVASFSVEYFIITTTGRCISNK